ncbi:hypothetical protein ACPV5G_21525, partial [Photobacterium damselae]|uniref:hypothetical protein n=1 Tax=Photobacterium damselae TaxID=38293 RepID=UPI0040677D79
QKWARKNPAVADKLFDVMHKATLAGVDPSKSFESMTDLLQSEVDRLNRKSKSNSKMKEEDAKRLKELQDAIKNEPFRRQQHALLRDQFSKLPNEAKRYFDDIKHHYGAQRGRMVMALEAR